MEQNSLRPAILALGAAVPKYRATQETIHRWMATSFAGRPRTIRWLKRLYTHSGIETRYACVPDFLEPPHHSRLAPGQDPAGVLTTAERMAIYEQEATGLGAKAGGQALTSYGRAANQTLAAATASITHLVVVSCTGFFAPGLDFALARRLDLDPTVERTLIGFMGCSAAFNGLRTATDIVRSRPGARVLVVCVELCSIHIQPGTNREDIISASLFADGASACVVGASAPELPGVFEIGAFHTGVKANTGDQMVWQIGDRGFTLRLSPQIPHHLAEAAPAALQALLGPHPRPQFWAIHPGGRAIVDRLGAIFQLRPDQVTASRAVLRRFGNLSSATILFVLAEIDRRLQQEAGPGRPVEGVAMAFGPGLVIEMARLIYRPGPTKNQEPAAGSRPNS